MSGKYKKIIYETPLLPWRVRNSFERWVETRGIKLFPSIYRLLSFGHLREIVKPVTSGPKHHFFGYYDKSPWNYTGSLLLAHEVVFNDRPPSECDEVCIGVVRLNNGNAFEVLCKSNAWNWQQGTMLQWHPADPENLFIHNDRRNDRFVSVVRNTNGKEVEVYERPIYAVTPDGKKALSLNFSRLHTHRPGYGYAGVPDPWADDKCPNGDGIFRIDLSNGTSELIISLHDLASNNPSAEMKDIYHWVNHIQVSPGGERFAFFHLWRVGEAGWGVRLYTANIDGSDMKCQLDAEKISHYDWMDDATIMIWAEDKSIGKHFLLCNIGDLSCSVIGDRVLTEDGHCSFSPDRKWVLNDTYPDRFDLRTLMLFRMKDEKRIDLARLYSPKAEWWGEIRCDLHPRWSRDGKRACIDSVHSGRRQMYIVDLPV